jgi:hypothetical protein
MPRAVLPLLAVTLALSDPARGADPRPADGPWQTLEPGLELGTFEGPTPEGRIAVVRIDPRLFELKLMSASAPGEGTLRSARGWAWKAGASAAINASMYQQDHRTSVSLMRTRDHVNQRRVSKDRAVLAFDPLAPGVAPARIIDLECEGLDAAGQGYGTLVQSIRLVSCHRRNVWAPSEQRFSTAAIGIDGAGRVLFVHARTAWDVHDLVNKLLALPIDLRQAMYVEGGAEAQLYVRGGEREVEFSGTLGAAPDVQLGVEGWPVPNVLAAVRRAVPLPKAPAAAAPPAPTGPTSRPRKP